MIHKDISPCARKGALYRMTPPSCKSSRVVLIPFRCGRSDCPVCARIKRSRLLRRLRAAPWPHKVYLWTITTDPSILSSDAALQSISRRWHRVCRNLYRLYPHLKYFRVLEFTKSGLPHLHVIFDQYVDWHAFRKLLMAQCFGRVLHYTTIPRDVAFGYMTKYITKSIEDGPYMRELHLRSWSASVHYLPLVHYFEEGTEFSLIWIGRLDWHLDQMIKLLQLSVSPSRGP